MQEIIQLNIQRHRQWDRLRTDAVHRHKVKHEIVITLVFKLRNAAIGRKSPTLVSIYIQSLIAGTYLKFLNQHQTQHCEEPS